MTMAEVRTTPKPCPFNQVAISRIVPSGSRRPNGSARVKKGGFLFFGSSPRPGPGSTVFVPTKDPSEEGFDVGGFVTGLVSVLASLTTVIVVLAR